MTDESVEVGFNGPDQYHAYMAAPLCLREMIFDQAKQIQTLTRRLAEAEGVVQSLLSYEQAVIDSAPGDDMHLSLQYASLIQDAQKVCATPTHKAASGGEG